MNSAEIIKAHGLYQCGMSLSKVAKRFGSTRQRLWSKFKRLGLKTRPLVRKESVEFNGAKYYRSRSQGYWRKGAGNRSALHRDTWEFFNGKIPEGYDIHHLDENKDNNSIDNLECLSKSEHTKKYGIFNNQFTKGKKERTLNIEKECPVCRVIFKKKNPALTGNTKTCSIKCRTEFLKCRKK